MNNFFPTFLDFLTEGPTGSMAGWFNVYTGQSFEGDEHHYILLGQHWRELGITEAKMKELVADYLDLYGEEINVNDPEDVAQVIVLDGQYGEWYKKGWVRWFRPAEFSMIDFTSNRDILEQGKQKIIEIAKSHDVTGITLSDKYGSEGHEPTFTTMVTSKEEILSGDFDF